MKKFHIDQFRCTLCSNWFNPPFSLPYRLKCTHSICTKCLQNSINSKQTSIICPEDLQKNQLSQITLNKQTKKALERLLKERKIFNQTDNLECIKSLALNFDQLLDSKQIELKNLSTLVDQIFENQIKRLRQIYEKIKMEINRPFRIVNDWKQVVRNNLAKLKKQSIDKNGPSHKNIQTELNHYVEEGRKIKLDLNQYMKFDFKELIQVLLSVPQTCFTHNFSIFDSIDANIKQLQLNSMKMKKNIQIKSSLKNLQKQLDGVSKNVILEDISNIQKKQANHRFNINTKDKQNHKKSLFEQIINETPLNKNKTTSSNNKQTPLNELMFSHHHKSPQSQNDHKNVEQLPFQIQITQNNSRAPSTRSTNQNRSKQEGYNKAIRQKIKKLKHSQIYQSKDQKNGNLKSSLQYSPDGFLDKYTIEESSIKQVSENMDNQESQSTTVYQVDNHYESEEDEEMLLNSNQNQQQEETQIKKKNTKSFKSQHLIQNPKQFPQTDLDQKSISQKLDERPRWNNSTNFNFLKQWQIDQHNIKASEDLQVIQRTGYNCQKEKNRYIQKMQQNRVKELLEQTFIGSNSVQLVGHSLHQANLPLYLSQMDWNRIQILKLIKTSLSDGQMNQLLNFLVHSRVQTLVLSHNNLTELSLDALLNFVEMNDIVKNVYLSKNNISLLKGHTKAKINLLKERGLTLYM